MKSFRPRGFTLAEMLVAVAVLGALLMIVGDAIAHTLHAESMDIGRASASRTAATLMSRLTEEARSSSAVFIPSADVLGNANGGTAAVGEVDFFRRLSAGGDAYVAYRFDPVEGTVTRYEYSRSNGSLAVGAQDLAAAGVAAFDARRLEVTQVNHDPNVRPVRVVYGAPDIVGGNGIVAVTFRTAASGGAPARNYEVHLTPMIAPMSMSILVHAATATTPPASPLPHPTPTPIYHYEWIAEKLQNGIYPIWGCFVIMGPGYNSCGPNAGTTTR